MSSLVLLTSGNLLAQEKPGVVSGRVYDERTSEPLAVVQIHIPGLGIGTLTNLDGRFMLRNVTPGTYDLVLELLGYATMERKGCFRFWTWCSSERGNGG